jgi:tetratricopeptide (TPR) repeat protein
MLTDFVTIRAEGRRADSSGGILAGITQVHWPAAGPVRDFLTHLDQLHRTAGQPSMSTIGKNVKLATTTVWGYFAGVRLVPEEHLPRLITFLGGEVGLATRLLRTARTARNEGTAEVVPQAVVEPQQTGPADDTTRLDIWIFTAATNRTNRPSLIVGREEIINSVNVWIDGGERVLLYGLGGCGKTAVAATIADRRIDAGKGPYLWLRTGAAQPEVVLDGLARRLGLVGAGGQELGLPRAISEAIMASGIRLVVIDDVWNPQALFEILGALPHEIGVIITSRYKIGLDRQAEVAGLAPEAAVRLLAQHARQESFLAHPEAHALCRDMGYHPYAIEIAGEYLRHYECTLAELRRDIDGEPHSLEMPARFAALGRESVRRLLDRSHAALENRDAGRAWAAFGAFATGTLTPELLACYLGIDTDRAIAALNALVDVSLARRVDGVRCYGIHDLTMSYARRVLSGTTPRALQLLDAVRGFVHANAGRHDVLALDLANVLWAAEQARDICVRDFVDIIEKLAMCGYPETHGHTLTLLRLLDAAIDILRITPEAERLHYLVGKRGNTYYNVGDLNGAAECYQEAIALAPSPHRQAVVLGGLGKVYAELGQPERSADCFRRAYAIAESRADDLALVRILEHHTVAAFRAKDYELVEDKAEQGVVLSRKLGERTLEATFLINHGSARFHIGVEGALEDQQQALAIAEDLGDEHILVAAHRGIGLDFHALERFEQARQHLEEALRLYRRLGHAQREEKLLRLMRDFGYLREDPDESAVASLARQQIRLVAGSADAGRRQLPV